MKVSLLVLAATTAALATVWMVRDEAASRAPAAARVSSDRHDPPGITDRRHVEADPDAGRVSTAFPDLVWSPQPFVARTGESVRYIDFANGFDHNDGSRSRPWRHHPWDPAATGRARAGDSADTYIFRRGVVYRGSLIASRSGQPGRPIRLTSDPDWGDGEAVLSGATQLPADWRRCAPNSAVAIPAASLARTWCTDRQGPIPRRVWEIRDGRAVPLAQARSPNWQVTDPDDPRAQWPELTGSVLQVRAEVEDASGFRAGDRVTGTGRWRDPDETEDNPDQGRTRVIDAGAEFVVLESELWRRGEIKSGSTITNGTWSTRVTGLGGSRDVILRVQDTVNLTAPQPDFYVGATIWSEGQLRPKPLAAKVMASNPLERTLTARFYRSANAGPGRYDRYFLEGLPQFLDAPGEFHYHRLGKNRGRLYLRTADDSDPNLAVIVAARDEAIVTIRNQSHIEVSGLVLRFNNDQDPGTPQARHAILYSAAVRIGGDVTGIRIANCRIAHVSAGVSAAPLPAGGAARLDDLVIEDNDFHDIDGTAVGLGNGLTHFSMKKAGSRLVHVTVRRNRIRNTGYRSLGHFGLGSQGHAIHVTGGEIVEIAGNDIDGVWGAGILAHNGTGYEWGQVARPLIRCLIHHNKVVNTLRGSQDFGGIASWHGGPTYIYSNISGNPVGYKHSQYRRSTRRDWYRTSAYGVGIYLDGQYKGYAFNNIVWGVNNDVNDRMYSSAAFNEAMGFMNTVFHNTFYRYGVGLHKGMTQHNRGHYLGNLMLDIGHKFIQQEVVPARIEYADLAFGANLMHGTPYRFGQMGRQRDGVQDTLQDWRRMLGRKGVLRGDTGELAPDLPVVSATLMDFRPLAGSAAVDRGVRVFVPWPLYAVVGEWHFFRPARQPGRVAGYNINMDREWWSFGMYQDIPRNDLRCTGVDSAAYETGILEDWTAGALRFGSGRYCVIRQEALLAGYDWQNVRSGGRGRFPAGSRTTVDMDRNSFIVEAQLRLSPGGAPGVVVAKRDTSGYQVDITPDGRPQVSLFRGGDVAARRTAQTGIGDGGWHHLLVEVDRGRPDGITIYVDGRPAGGEFAGDVTRAGSLSNQADFLVGGGPEPGFPSLDGALDFLRVSRGTLADAETGIDELYQWQFDGPANRDFLGRSASGRRDIGALEAQ